MNSFDAININVTGQINWIQTHIQPELYSKLRYSIKTQGIKYKAQIH